MMELITLGILAGIIVALLAYHVFYVRETNKEKSKLINSIISKNATELRDLELTEKVKPIKAAVDKPPEFVPVSDLNDEQFSEAMEKEIA